MDDEKKLAQLSEVIREHLEAVHANADRFHELQTMDNGSENPDLNAEQTAYLKMKCSIA